MRFFVAVVMAGCWAGEPTPSSPPPEPEIAAPAKPRLHHTIWAGQYDCAQGITNVRLVLDIEPAGATTGVFEFFAAPENPTVPSGSYRLRGKTSVGAGGTIAIDVDGESWIDQPASYMMVGIHATSDPTRHHLAGRITNPSCGMIQVDRRD